MLQISHIVVLSQPDFVAREVRSVMSGHQGFRRWFGFTRRP